MPHPGERLRFALSARHFKKQMAFAAEVGVDDSVVSRWQQGKTLSMPNAIRVCEVLDISLDWLLLGRGTIDSHRQVYPSVMQERLQLATSGLPDSVLNALAAIAEAIRTELNPDRHY
jgi:transcriptional regulator with XRE-family HTH domain